MLVNQDNETSMDDVQSTKNPVGGIDVCVVYCRGISDMRTKDIKVHNG